MKEENSEKDITDLLQAWTFDPEANVRRIEGEDGIEKIQVRIDQGAFQGILQLDLDGRPDGRSRMVTHLSWIIFVKH